MMYLLNTQYYDLVVIFRDQNELVSPRGKMVISHLSVVKLIRHLH